MRVDCHLFSFSFGHIHSSHTVIQLLYLSPSLTLLSLRPWMLRLPTWRPRTLSSTLVSVAAFSVESSEFFSNVSVCVRDASSKSSIVDTAFDVSSVDANDAADSVVSAW